MRSGDAAIRPHERAPLVGQRLRSDAVPPRLEPHASPVVQQGPLAVEWTIVSLLLRLSLATAGHQSITVALRRPPGGPWYNAALYCDKEALSVRVDLFKVSERGQMALPVDARRRWQLSQGGAVEVVDLGPAILIVPAGRGGLRSLVSNAIDDAGGYAALAAEVAKEEPELA